MIKILSRLSHFVPVGALCAILFWANAARVHAETGFVNDKQVEVRRISQGRFIYPRAALRREIEGFVKIQLTLGETGRVIDAFVLEASPPNRFEKNALKNFVYFSYYFLSINVNPGGPPNNQKASNVEPKQPEEWGCPQGPGD
mgnify:CR=1 FL=1